MLIPSDLPFLGHPNIKHRSEEKCSAWVYPWSPIIMVDFDLENLNESEEKKLILLVDHELSHINQIMRIFPLNLLLSYLIIKAYSAPILSGIDKENIDVMRAIVTEYAPLLEGIAILEFLTKTDDVDLHRIILNDLYRGENHVHMEGIKSLFCAKELSKDQLSNQIYTKKNQIRQSINQIVYLFNAMALAEEIERDKNAKDVWTDNCIKIAAQGLNFVKEFLSHPPGHDVREKILKKALAQWPHTIDLWKGMFKKFADYELIKGSYVENLLRQVNPFNRKGASVPYFFTNGHFEVVYVPKMSSNDTNPSHMEDADWGEGADWFYHLIEMEILIKKAYRRAPFICPIFKMTMGAGMEYFCFDTEPDLKYCTSLALKHKDSKLDVSFRAGKCDFWKFLDGNFKRQFGEMGRAQNYSLTGNKIILEGSGRILIGDFMEGIDYSTEVVITKAEMEEFMNEIEETHLNKKWRSSLAEDKELKKFVRLREKEFSGKISPIMFTKNGMKMAKSKSEYFDYLRNRQKEFQFSNQEPKAEKKNGQ